MNYLQFLLFAVFVISVWFMGIAVRQFVDTEHRPPISKFVYVGEALLLGAIVVVTELLLLSLLHLYYGPFLWGCVLLNMLVLLSKDVRGSVSSCFCDGLKFDVAVSVFFVLCLIFIFRNCYFLIDIDSLSTYLFTQKLWLKAGSSLVGDLATDVRVFLPQFDAVPYSLGLTLFGQETLFPQLITVFWRLIVLLLVFGFTKFRFNGYYGLAAVMFVLFNEHFFYSGANQWVIINGALIALMFASAYNFWLASQTKSRLSLSLAIIFALQLIANKYQMIYVFMVLIALGLFIQSVLSKMLLVMIRNGNCVLLIAFSLFSASLWYLKNFLVTHDPTFPALAGPLKAFGWTMEQWDVFRKTQQGTIGPSGILKYLNYFFVWPGITATKLVGAGMSFFPLIALLAFRVSRVDHKSFVELCYWLSLSILVVFSIAVAIFMDPRYFRFAIAVCSFTVVAAVDFIFKSCLRLRSTLLVGLCLLWVSINGGFNEGIKIMWRQNGNFKYPTFRENIQVIFNRWHMIDAIKKHHPEVNDAIAAMHSNAALHQNVVWDIGFQGGFPSFLLSARLVVSPLWNNLVKWNSYPRAEAIMGDLSAYGIDRIGRLTSEGPVFISTREYADELAKYDRRPKSVLFDYGFPEELSTIAY